MSQNSGSGTVQATPANKRDDDASRAAKVWREKFGLPDPMCCGYAGVPRDDQITVIARAEYHRAKHSRGVTLGSAAVGLAGVAIAIVVFVGAADYFTWVLTQVMLILVAALLILASISLLRGSKHMAPAVYTLTEYRLRLKSPQDDVQVTPTKRGETSGTSSTRPLTK